MKTAFVFASCLTMISSVWAAPLATTTVNYRVVENTYDAVANAEAERQSTVSSQVNGRILAIYFRAGDKVQQGQAIMRIDSATANDDVAGMQARVREAEVQRDNLQKQLEEVNDIKQYPVFSTNDRASVIITKPNPKKRKGKTVQEWEDEIDLGHAG